MWSIYLAVVILMPLTCLLATILHWYKLIDANNMLVHFSVLKNIQSFIPKKIKDKSEDKSSHKFQDPSILFDGIRIFWQIQVIMVHFWCIFYYEFMKPDEQLQGPFQLLLDYLAISYIRYGMSFFLLFNGIASGKWFCEQIKRNGCQSFLKLTARFYLQRFLAIGPITYLFIFSTIFYLKFITKSLTQNGNNFCSDGVFPHILFILNFYRSDYKDVK